MDFRRLILGACGQLDAAVNEKESVVKAAVLEFFKRVYRNFRTWF
jgi:hypothetical protein